MTERTTERLNTTGGTSCDHGMPMSARCSACWDSAHPRVPSAGVRSATVTPVAIDPWVPAIPAERS